MNTLPSPSGSQQYAVCYEQSADKASLSAFVDGEGKHEACANGELCACFAPIPPRTDAFTFVPFA